MTKNKTSPWLSKHAVIYKCVVRFRLQAFCTSLNLILDFRFDAICERNKMLLSKSL